MKRNYVQVKSVPGPKGRELLERRSQTVPKGVGNNTPIFVKQAHGALLEDVDGNVFLDFAGAIGTLNAGHTPAGVVKAVQEQAARYLHTCFHVAMYEPYIELAEKLASLTPGSFAKKTILLNSGAEAVENAVKIARKYTGRSGIVSFTRGFHGRTLLGMSLTSKVKPYKFQMGPYAPGVYKAPYPYVYHRPEGMTEEGYTEYCLQEFRNFLLTEAAPEELAAVILEPVQGEGGFVVAPKAYVQGVYEICQQHGILFIADEIQTGFGRTGTWFASEQFGIEPDLVTMSKSLAAGVPISAVTGRAEIMDAAAPGELGGTYGGSPLGCAAALEVIQLIEQEKLAERANVMGGKLRAYLEHLQQQFPVIGDVRGLGAMVAMELTEPDTKEPAKAFTASLLQRCWETGVILLGAGIYGNVVRFLIPLVISDEQLEEGLQIIEEAFAELHCHAKRT